MKLYENVTSENIFPICVISTLSAMSSLLDDEGLEGLLGIAQATLIKQSKTRLKRLISLTSQVQIFLLTAQVELDRY